MKTFKNKLKKAFEKYCEAHYQLYKPMYEAGYWWM